MIAIDRRAPRWWLPGIGMLSGVILVTALAAAAHRQTVVDEAAANNRRLADLTFVRSAFTSPGTVRAFRGLQLAAHDGHVRVAADHRSEE